MYCGNVQRSVLKEFAVHHSKWLIFLVRLYQQHNEHTISHNSSIRTRKGTFPSIYMRLKSCSSEHKPFFGSFIMIGCIVEMFREMFLKEFAVHHSKWLIFLVRLYQQHNEHTILHDSTTFHSLLPHKPFFFSLLKQTFKNCIGCL